MHENFNNWYREANFQPAAETLQNRWSAIEKLCSRKKDVTTFALELLRVYIGYKPKEETFLESLIASFSEFDPDYPMRRNSYENRILAGISLINLIEKKPTNISQLITLAVLCGSFQGRIKHPLKDLYQISKDNLHSISANLRRFHNFQDFDRATLDLNEFLTQLTTAAESNQIPKLNEPLQTLFSRIIEFANNILDDHKKSSLYIQLQQEEIDMLWWLLTKTSREYEKPYTAFSFYTACMLIPKELADLTKVIPGPLAIESLMRRMYEVFGDRTKSKITLRKVVNELPKDFTTSLLDGIDYEFDHLFPLHIALKLSLENGDEKEWSETFDEISKLKSRHPLNPIDISKQFYQERLLLGALNI